MTLYQIRNNKNTGGFDVKRYDDDLNYENTYNLTFKGRQIMCNCPAYGYKCRHRDMLPIFELERAIDSGRFYDFTNKKWIEGINEF